MLHKPSAFSLQKIDGPKVMFLNRSRIASRAMTKVARAHLSVANRQYLKESCSCASVVDLKSRSFFERGTLPYRFLDTLVRRFQASFKVIHLPTFFLLLIRVLS